MENSHTASEAEMKAMEYLAKFGGATERKLFEISGSCEKPKDFLNRMLRLEYIVPIDRFGVYYGLGKGGMSIIVNRKELWKERRGRIIYVGNRNRTTF